MEKFSENVKQAQESLGPGRLRSGLRAAMSQFQCLSCSLSSSFYFCSGYFSLTRASSHISVLLPQVPTHLQECFRCTTGWWGAVWDFPGLLASPAVSSRDGSPGHQEHFDVTAFTAKEKEPSWTPGTEMRINTLRRADVLQRNRWKRDL